MTETPSERSGSVPEGDDEGPCTTCDDTGVTIQTERACSCEAGDEYRITPASAQGAEERAVMVCPQCEGEGSYADGLDEAACSTECTRCGSNGWIVDLAALVKAPRSIEGAEERARELLAAEFDAEGLARSAAQLREGASLEGNHWSRAGLRAILAALTEAGAAREGKRAQWQERKCRANTWPEQAIRIAEALEHEVMTEKEGSLWCCLCGTDCGSDGRGHSNYCVLFNRGDDK